MQGYEAYTIKIDGETNVNRINVFGDYGLEVIKESLTFKLLNKSHVII
ncbi:hypothetical protein [Clostridium sp. DJ247]|nr:hypothetical protein [Clostridium sp. DJ247]MBC2582145.1 hypothetical protein [Clostridium sp. DJ247]